MSKGIEGTIDCYLRYDTEFKVLICLSCQHCLTRLGVEKHFQRCHRVVPINVRKQLVRFSEGLAIVEPKDVRMPLIEIKPIAGLKVVEGVICDVCGSLYGTVPSMEIHCWKEHGWRRWQGLMM
jgi:hypothetical protein